MQLSNDIAYHVTRKEFEVWQGKLFSYVHEVYRRVMRAEYYYALTMINNLRSFIVAGWNMEADRHSNEAWDWSKIEGERSQLETWQLKMLSLWMCGRNQGEIMKTLYSMIPEIRRLNEVLSKKTGEEMDSDRLDQIFNLIL